MRDISRIDAFCQRLAAAWKKFPDQRFGQFIMNAFCTFGKDPFFVEEDEMLRRIEGWVAANSPYHKATKSRLDVLLDKFPRANAIYEDEGLCVQQIFGRDVEDCDHFNGTCKECWLKPAPGEYQDKEDK